MKAEDLSYHLFDTVFGCCGIVWSRHGLTRLQLPERDRRATESSLIGRNSMIAQIEPPPVVLDAVRRLQEYFDGHRVDFSTIDLDLCDTPPFFLEVYRLTRALKWGETATYGDLAGRAGSPGAARAIGQAMARNPIPVIIPCHRVLAANRRVGGFSAPGGTVTKERLLGLEGISLAAELPLFGGFDPGPLRSSTGSRS